MHLQMLIEPKPDLVRLAKVLDELGHLGRVDTIRRWEQKHQAALFEAALGFRPLTLDDFVPPSVEPAHEVIHHGKNTLPAFTHFQKRFCRPPQSSEAAVGAAPDTAADAGAGADATRPELWGYNHQDLAWATGPGYFVVHQGEGEGEVDIDYRAVPPAGAKLPAGWPAVVPNSVRLGGLVYGGMIDVMRGISTHVSIGRAKKPTRASDKARFMNAWFVLCREDP